MAMRDICTWHRRKREGEIEKGGRVHDDKMGRASRKRRGRVQHKGIMDVERARKEDCAVGRRCDVSRVVV